METVTSEARLAFVGAGAHATQSLYPNLPLIPGFRLVAVCDLDAGKARRAAERYGAAVNCASSRGPCSAWPSLRPAWPTAPGPWR